MKLTTGNTFDVSQVASTKSFQELEPFFEYINTFSSDVVQAFSKKITFGDNINFSTKTLNLQHGVGVNIGLMSVIAVLIQSNAPYIGYKLSTLADSSRVLYVYFKAAQNFYATSALWQAGTIVRYKGLDVSPFSVGDVLTFSGFGTANNNGSYPIIEIDTDNNYVYVNNRNRTSATGDESKTSFVGAVAETYLVQVGFIHS